MRHFLFIVICILLVPVSAQAVVFNYASPSQIDPGASTTISLTVFEGSIEDYEIIFNNPGIQIESKTIDGDQMTLWVSTSNEAEPGQVDIEVRHLPTEQSFYFSQAFFISQLNYPDQVDQPEADRLRYDLDIETNIDKGFIGFIFSTPDEFSSISLELNSTWYAFMEMDGSYVAKVDFLGLGLSSGDGIRYRFGINDEIVEEKVYIIPNIVKSEIVLHNPVILSVIENDQPSYSFLELLVYYILNIFIQPAAMSSLELTGDSGSFNTYEIEIPNEEIYNKTVYDYHIMFNGTVTDCSLRIPPWPQGWRCAIKGKRIEVYNNMGEPLPIGQRISGLEIETVPKNAQILDRWETTNTTPQPIENNTGERIINGVNVPYVKFTDCNGFCTNITDAQFKQNIKDLIIDSCQKIKNALFVVENEIDMIQSGIPADKIKMANIKPNRERLADILRKTLVKCNQGVLIECDSSWNTGCSSGETNAYIPETFGVVSYSYNLHICPAFCTDRDKQKTITHELTHYGDSIDDINDDLNADNLASLINWLDEAYKRETIAYL